MKMLAQKIHSGPFGKFVAGKVLDQKSENTGVAREKPSTQEKMCDFSSQTDRLGVKHPSPKDH